MSPTVNAKDVSEAYKVFNGNNVIADTKASLSMEHMTFEKKLSWKNRTMRCPVCSSLSCPILARSSNHSCGVQFGGRSSSDPGEQAVYGECKVCAHVATDYFDGWPDRRFKEQIYNADYHIHDPGYVARRPKSTADAVTRFYSTSTKSLTMDLVPDFFLSIFRKLVSML